MDKDNKKTVKGRKNITIRKRNPNNVWDSKYVTYFSKCESYTSYVLLQLVCAISTPTISFELLAIAISDCINISESFVMPYLSSKVLIVLISIELLAIAISGYINISESFVIPSFSPKVLIVLYNSSIVGL